MKQEILEIGSKELSIEIAGNKISSIRNKNISRKGARVFQKGKIYSASFVGKVSDKELIENAVANKDGAIEFDYELETTEEVSSTIYMEHTTRNGLYPEYEKALEYLNKKHSNFIISGKAKQRRVHKNLRYLNEIESTIYYDYCEWHMIYKHKKSGGIMDGYFGADFIGDFEIMPEVERYSQFLDSFEKEVSLKAGKIPVVFMSPQGYFGKILESVRADFYKKDIGLFKGKLGETILSPKLSLYDVSFDPAIIAMDLFDAEGFVRENPRLPLIEKGVFKTIIADSRNAQKFSIPKTGNTKRAFDSHAGLGFNTVVAGEGSRSAEAILADLPECIVVEVASGGDVTDLGDFSTPVQNAFLAKNGKIRGKIPQITLLSSIQKMFGEDLLEVANSSLSALSHGPSLFMEMEVLLN